MKLIDGTFDDFDVKFVGPEFVKFTYFLEGDNLQIKMNVTEENFGDYEGKIIINHDSTRYVIPFLLHYTPGSILINQQDEKLFFDIYHPEEWSFAKISVTNSKDGKTDTTTVTPNKKSSIEIYENAEYWIDAKIKVNGNTSSAFNTIKISSLPENSYRLEIIDIPEKQVGIIAGIVIIIGTIGLIKRQSIK
jgi:minor extracellular serine protease Vpr